MEKQGARARDKIFFSFGFFFLADRGDGDQGALLGSAMPVWDGIRSLTKSPSNSTPEDHGFEPQPAPHIGGGEGGRGALLGQARPVWDRICIPKKPTAVASAAAEPLP